jgi:hypothetical protein
LLTPGLNTVEALFHKLEREAYRAYHSVDLVHKLDHFFNFCVTAHSLRDFFFESKGLNTAAAKDPYHQRWNADPALVAAADIANSSKHCTLRLRDGSPRMPATKRTRSKVSRFVDIYTGKGRVVAIPISGPDIEVTLSDGSCLALDSFAPRVIREWQSFLASEGIRVRRLSVAQLIAKTPNRDRAILASLDIKKSPKVSSDKGRSRRPPRSHP